ncbi:MAG: hypothetical protein CMF06_03430 [Hyphomonas sp.]|nr:hypothetical protein [Hyphomonas sp.]
MLLYSCHMNDIWLIRNQSDCSVQKVISNIYFSQNVIQELNPSSQHLLIFYHSSKRILYKWNALA